MKLEWSAGFEPAIDGFAGRALWPLGQPHLETGKNKNWGDWSDSNRRLPESQSRALPTKLQPPLKRRSSTQPGAGRTWRPAQRVHVVRFDFAAAATLWSAKSWAHARSRLRLDPKRRLAVMNWCRGLGSNQRPPAFQAGTLPTELPLRCNLGGQPGIRTPYV